MDHDRFLERLLALFPGQVFLVGRYADAGLGLKDDGVLRFFLPDFHWMSRERAEHYTGGYRFNGNSLLPAGQPVFSTFLQALEAAAAAAAAGDGSVEIFQLLTSA